MASVSGISSPVDFTKSINTDAVKGKTALITGGASGIGAGISKALAEAGAHVTIADLNTEAGEKYAAELQKQGLSVQFAQTDVSNWTSQLNAFKTAISSSPTKSLNLAITCAGLAGGSIFQFPPFVPQEGDPENPQPPPLDVFNVNLTGSYYTACLALHFFRQQASAKGSDKVDQQLIFIASNIAYAPIPLYSMYSASKMGVRALWRSLRESPDLTGMRTNLVAPHIIRTPMTKELQPMLDEKGVEMVDPGKIIDVLMRMACDESISGRAVAINQEGPFDLCDELQDYDGAREFGKKHEKETKAVWDFMTGLLRTGVQPVGVSE